MTITRIHEDAVLWREVCAGTGTRRGSICRQGETRWQGSRLMVWEESGEIFPRMKLVVAVVWGLVIVAKRFEVK